MESNNSDTELLLESVFLIKALGGGWQVFEPASHAAATTVSMLVATPKPRLVHLVITRAGEKAFAVETASYMAALFRVKVEIGGLAGLVAPLLGKQPPDTIVSILEGDAPGFVRSDGPLYAGGPIWRIELASPSPSPAQP